MKMSIRVITTLLMSQHNGRRRGCFRKCNCNSRINKISNNNRINN